MTVPTIRAPLGALLTLLLASGCSDGPVGADLAGTGDPAFASVLARQIETAAAARLPDAAMLAAAGGAQVQFITEPTTITAPGFYLVTQDFSATADGIVVQSDHVHLDLGGHTITGPGHMEGRGVVVDGSSHVLVSGGTLTTFGMGVVLVGASQSAVVGVNVVGGDVFADPPNGIPPQVGFLLVNSAHNRLVGNAASMVNLGYFVRGGGSGFNRLSDNLAEAGTNGLLGICYNPAPDTSDPTGPSRDLVRDNFFNGFGTGIQTSADSAQNRFLANRIYYHVSPYEDLNGTNVFRNNVTMQLPP